MLHKDAPISYRNLYKLKEKFQNINIDYIKKGTGKPILLPLLETEQIPESIAEQKIYYLEKELDLAKKEIEILREKNKLLEDKQAHENHT